MSEGSNVYEAKGVVALAAQMGLYTGGVGLFISAIQNALTSHNRGAMGVFTRTGGTIGFFGAHSSMHPATSFANLQQR